MSEIPLDLNDPQLSAEDWRFMENGFGWFFTPQNKDTASKVPQWAGNGYRYSLYLGNTADDLAVHGIIRWDTDVAKGDVFQFIPQTKQILVTKDFHPDFPDYDYENVPQASPR